MRNSGDEQMVEPPIGPLTGGDPITVQIGVEVSSLDMSVPEIVSAQASPHSGWRVDDDGYGYCSREWLDGFRSTVRWLQGRF